MSINDLPSELLSEIVSFAALYCPNRNPSYKSFLLDLCLVSKTWRDIAYANQALWSFIDIVFATNPDCRRENPSHLPLDPRLFDRVCTWLQRSGLYPKTYTIWAPRNKRGGEDACLLKQDSTGNDHLCPLTDPTLIRLLVKGPPVAKLAVTCPSSNCFKNLVRYLDIAYTFKWDSVKELMVDCWEGQQDWTEPASLSLSMFRFFKSLTAFNLALPSESYTDLSMYPPPVGMPMVPPSLLQGLRALTFSCNWDGPWIALVLSGCSNLEELSIDFMSGPAHLWLGKDDWAKQVPALSGSTAFARYAVLPQLHTLRVRNIEVHTVSRVLRFLRTPSLQHLHTSFITKYGMDNDPEVDYWTDDEEGGEGAKGPELRSEDELEGLAVSSLEMGGAAQGERGDDEQDDTPEHQRLTISTIRDFLRSFLISPGQPHCSTLISLEIGQTPYNSSPKGALLALDMEELAEISILFPALLRFSLYRDEPAETMFIHLCRPAVREEDPTFYPPLGCLDTWKPSTWCTRSDYERRGGVWSQVPEIDVKYNIRRFVG